MNQPFDHRGVQADFAADAFTAHDFLQMLELGAFEDMRAELVGGVIEKRSPAEGEHAQSNFGVGNRIAQALENEARIAIDLVIVIDEKTVRAVDIAVAIDKFPKRAAKGTDLLLGVEIAETTLSRDLGAKARDYARAGLPNYWVVDLKGRVAHVMAEPSPEGYARRDVIRFCEPLAVPGSSKTIVIDG
jgi:Uma2 family endonuclease